MKHIYELLEPNKELHSVIKLDLSIIISSLPYEINKSLFLFKYKDIVSHPLSITVLFYRTLKLITIFLLVKKIGALHSN